PGARDGHAHPRRDERRRPDRGEADAPVLRALRPLPSVAAQGRGVERRLVAGDRLPRPEGAPLALRRAVPEVRDGAVPETPRVHRVRPSGRAHGGAPGTARYALHPHQPLPHRETQSPPLARSPPTPRWLPDLLATP